MRLIARSRQLGQAMVEYAILLIVMMLMVAGGLELAMAAYNGFAAKQGAMAGAQQWAENLATATYDPVDGYVLQYGLGDHAAVAFSSPACNADGTYDDGLPVDSVTNSGDKLYLYNPLMIDLSSCDGNDPAYPQRSRVSVLIAGNLAEGGSYAGLPALNRAVYAMYQKAYVSGADFVSPSEGFDSVFLKMPGYLDPVDEMVKLVSYNDGNLQALPTFALQCRAASAQAFEDCDSAASPEASCWADAVTPLPCAVQVQFRYRHIFESLVLMGVSGAPEEVDLEDRDLFNSSAPVEGILGSELRQLGSASTPGTLGAKLKARKDFLGCYETSVSLNANAVELSGVSRVLVNPSVPSEGYEITVTTARAHGFAPGRNVSIAGVDIVAYNGIVEIEETSATTFTFLSAVDPGAPDVSSASAVMATVLANPVSSSSCSYTPELL